MTDTIVFDAGALIGFEKRSRDVVRLIVQTSERGARIAVPAGVVAQVWRDGSRQARLAWLLGIRELVIEPLDDRKARAAGQLCGVTRTADIVDASVVLCARTHGARIVTSDPEDLRRLDPKADLIVI